MLIPNVLRHTSASLLNTSMMTSLPEHPVPTVSPIGWASWMASNRAHGASAAGWGRASHTGGTGCGSRGPGYGEIASSEKSQGDGGLLDLSEARCGAPRWPAPHFFHISVFCFTQHVFIKIYVVLHIIHSFIKNVCVCTCIFICCKGMCFACKVQCSLTVYVCLHVLFNFW